jgi:GntR family transcriptional regulator, rspAB operon transcriptional repressor
MNPIDRLPPLRLDRSRQAAPQVFDALRELIVSLELPPGTVLPRAALAERFGVSQTPVRDALTKLGEEGLVDIFPQHATLVSRIDIASALRAHFLRRSLELEIVRDLAGRTPAEVAALVGRLRGAIARQMQALGPEDYAAFTHADHDFHHELYEAAGMAELWQLVRQRSGHVDRLRRLNLPEKGKAQAVVRDHKAIVRAIAAHDPLAAQDALRTHLAGTLTFVDQVRQRHPDFVTG